MTCKIIRCDWIVALLLLSISAACSGERASEHRNEHLLEVDTFQDPFQKYKLKPKETYLAIRDSVSRERNRLWAQYQSVNNEKLKEEILDSAGKVFTRSIVYHLMPYWYGTPWTFEGHTDVPGQGEVACGYLVSTTLKHAGLNINRYKLAQQASSVG